MNLYTFFKENNKVVYGTFAEGATHFLYSGFESAEEAKNATFEWHFNYRKSQLEPNPQGITQSTEMLKAEIEMTLKGKWSEIE